MIAVIRTDGGSFNIFGTRGDFFSIQGNLDLEELEELKEAVDEALDEARRELTV